MDAVSSKISSMKKKWSGVLKAAKMRSASDKTDGLPCGTPLSHAPALIVGISEEQGRRPAMEDRTLIVDSLRVPGLEGTILAPQTLLAVMDGHGGSDVVIWLHNNLANVIKDHLQAAAKELSEPSLTLGEQSVLVTSMFTKAFAYADTTLISTCGNAANGSTATVALLLGPVLYIANLGDSTGVLCRGKHVQFCTIPHKPDDKLELDRVIAAGGMVWNGRVMGELATSRAFGDVHLKIEDHTQFPSGVKLPAVTGGFDLGPFISNPGQVEVDSDDDEPLWEAPLLSVVPDVTCVPLTDIDSFILLGSDGLFDVLSVNGAVDLAMNLIKKRRGHGVSLDLVATDVAKTLTLRAIEAGSRDNVTALLAIIKPAPTHKTTLSLRHKPPQLLSIQRSRSESELQFASVCSQDPT